MNNNNSNNNNKRTGGEESYLKVALWLARKAKEERVSFDQLIAYCWLYTKNSYARRQRGEGVYGKKTYKQLWGEIENDLGIFDVGDLCRALEKAGWISKAPAKAYQGQRQVGYLCLLAKDQAAEAKAVQQELRLSDEETVVVVESAVESRGEYWYGGVRFYDDAEGNPHRVPTSAPARPTKTAVWLDDPEGWFEPEEIAARESEY